jgi:hypothetical protein
MFPQQDVCSIAPQSYVIRTLSVVQYAFLPDSLMSLFLFGLFICKKPILIGHPKRSKFLWVMRECTIFWPRIELQGNTNINKKCAWVQFTRPILLRLFENKLQEWIIRAEGEVKGHRRNITRMLRSKIPYSVPVKPKNVASCYFVTSCYVVPPLGDRYFHQCRKGGAGTASCRKWRPYWMSWQEKKWTLLSDLRGLRTRNP